MAIDFSKVNGIPTLTLSSGEVVSLQSPSIASDPSTNQVVVSEYGKPEYFIPLSKPITVGGVAFNGTAAELATKIRDEVFVAKGSIKAIEPDYVITRVVDTYYAYTIKSGLTEFSGASASTVIQSAINAITPTGAAATGGGWIHCAGVEFNLFDELVIDGWEPAGTNYSSIKITGVGYSTILRAKGVGKSGIVVRNRANVVLDGFYMSVGATSVSGIKLAGDGTDSERSINKGIINNVWINSGGTGPAFHAQNFFNLNVPHMICQSTTNHGALLEQTSTTTNYGNSNFGFFQANGANSGTFAGLSIQSDIAGKYLNLLHFSSLYVGSGKRGLHIKNCIHNTFSFVDIEYSDNPIYFEGAASKETLNNSIISGYLYPNVGGTAIHADQYTTSNLVRAYVTADNATVKIINDLVTTNAGNDYDLTLSFSADHTNKTITSRTGRVRIKRRGDGAVIDSHAGPSITILPANVSNDTTSLADVTGLSFPVIAGVTYKFKFYINFFAASTTGAGWTINGPASPTLLTYEIRSSTALATEQQFNGVSAYDYPSMTSTSTPSTNNFAVIEGVIKPSASGTVIARFASEVAASAVTANGGKSYVEYQQIG